MKKKEYISPKAMCVQLDSDVLAETEIERYSTNTDNDMVTKDAGKWEDIENESDGWW